MHALRSGSRAGTVAPIKQACTRGEEQLQRSTAQRTLSGRATKPSAAENSSRPACVLCPLGAVSWKNMGPFLNASWPIRLAPALGGSRICERQRRRGGAGC